MGKSSGGGVSHVTSARTVDGSASDVATICPSPIANSVSPMNAVRSAGTSSVTAPARTSVSLLSGAEEQARRLLLDDVRALTDEVFPGLDVGPEIFAAEEQAIGETVLVQGEAALEGVAVCHVGAGSEAGSDTCYVKVAAVRPGAARPPLGLAVDLRYRRRRGRRGTVLLKQSRGRLR